MARKSPRQKPHESVQSVGTPRAFLRTLSRRFGRIVIDLAADGSNRVVREYYGPGSPWGTDSLARNWVRPGLCFLNPEFTYIMPWAAKSAQESRLGAQVALLTPASLGSDWWVKYVQPYALSLILKPRLTFIGHDTQYPKDLMLSLFGPRWFPAVRVWYHEEPDQPWLPDRRPSGILECGALTPPMSAICATCLGVHGNPPCPGTERAPIDDAA